MKKIFTMIAVALLAAGSLSAQTMTIKIEGQEVKNGDDIVIHKEVKETVLSPALKVYDLGVEVEFKSLIAQTVEASGIDHDKVTPGLACCPIGFTCTTANDGNGWLSGGTMKDLEAGREVNGEWIHYNYGMNNKPAEGTVRKSTITFKGASETISFNLTIDTNTSSGISNVAAETTLGGASYNLAGQRVSGSQKGIVIRNGKKVVIK